MDPVIQEAAWRERRLASYALRGMVSEHRKAAGMTGSGKGLPSRSRAEAEWRVQQDVKALRRSALRVSQAIREVGEAVTRATGPLARLGKMLHGERGSTGA